jgi:N-methylhydantoinase A
LRIGLDTGGTFTDLVVLDERTGHRRTMKVPSTPHQPSVAVFEALSQADVAPEAIGFFVLGTTIATNCLIERKGQRVLFLTTAGFEDIPFIQRINRPSLFDLQWVKPDPYVARPDCIGVRERLGHDGRVRTPLTDDEIERVVEEVSRRASRAEGGIAVAITLLFAYVDAAHEQWLAAAIRAALPDVPVSVSSDVAPIWREYERSNTVIVDAYLRTLVGRFVEELDAELGRRGVTAPRFILKSNGGQVPIHAATEQPVNLALSGLAGGLIGGKHFADEATRSDVITLDMGGTSADVGVIVDGRIRSRRSYEFEWGLPISLPVVDLTTIGAGGSSIAGFDRGGFLKVGPDSAGADPGPAAYGRGGAQATVTDAHLTLGRLNPDYFLGGAFPLDVERGQVAMGAIAERLGSSLEDAAQAVIDLATENMANAIRLLAADRGLDYRRFDLMAFGGAGPLHGSMLMDRIGVAQVLVPPNPGLASALGTLAADLRVDRRLTRLMRSDHATDAALRETFSQVGREAVEELRREGGVTEPTLVLSVSCRYLGQNFEQDVAVPVDAEGDLVDLVVERFHRAHEATYGYRIAEAVVELVYFDAVAIERQPALPRLHVADGDVPQPEAVRPVYFKRVGWADTPIYRRNCLTVGNSIGGPLVVEEVDSTTVVLPGHALSVHAAGSLVISPEQGDYDPTRSSAVVGARSG